MINLLENGDLNHIMSTPVGDVRKIITTMKREQVLLRLIALILIGAGINIAFIGLVFWNISHPYLPDSVLQMLSPDADPNVELSASDHITIVQVIQWTGYFVITIAYSVGTSMAFKPKRIVSPLFIQAITVSYFLIVISVPLVLFSNAIPEDYIQNVFAIGMLVSLPLLIVGFIQTEIVRRIVGLNEPFDELDKKVFVLDDSYEKIRTIMLSDDFKSLAEFVSYRTKSKNRLVLISKARTTEKLIFVLTPDKSNKKSILATIAYDIRLQTIINSNTASVWRDSIVSFLKDTMEKEPILDNDPLKSEAFTVAQRFVYESTKPKIVNIIYLPPYQKTVLIITAIIGGITFAVWQINLMDASAFYATIILIIIELMFVFVPSVIERIKPESDYSID